MKICKYCRQEWKEGTRKCPHCGSESFVDFQEEKIENTYRNTSLNKKNESIGMQRIIALVVVAIVICGIVFLVGKIRAYNEEKKAHEAKMTMNYELGMKYYESGDYVSAIKNLRNIDESFEAYMEASSVLNEIEGSFKSSTLEQVDILIEQEAYDDAANSILILSELFPEDLDIVVKMQSIKKQVLLSKISASIEDENYTDVILLIESTEEDVKNDPEIQNKYNDVVTAYLNQIECEAENAFEDGGVSSAVSVINEALAVLPDNNELVALVNYYNERIPIDLFSLQPFIGKVENNLYSTLGDADNMGNTNYAYEAIIPGRVNDMVWIINKEYKNLKFDVGLENSCNNKSSCSWIEIYEGERMIMQTDKFTAGVRPQTYNVDITGVDELRVVFKDDQPFYGTDSPSLLISNFWISK